MFSAELEWICRPPQKLTVLKYFWSQFHSWQEFLFSTKLSIFDKNFCVSQNFYFWPNFRFLPKISIFTKFPIWSRFPFFTKNIFNTANFCDNSAVNWSPTFWRSPILFNIFDLLGVAYFWHNHTISALIGIAQNDRSPIVANHFFFSNLVNKIFSTK